MRVLLLLVASLSFAATAEMKLTVSQLVQFLNSAIQQKNPDKEVADYLHHIKLSDRLDDRTIEDLQGRGAGPKTVAVLKELRDSSSTLAVPPPPAPKPVVVQIPPPDAIEQGKILDEVRDYALSYSKQLPNFICVQVTRRYADPRGAENWYKQDTITARLSYFDQHEDYKVVLINDQPQNEISMMKVGGGTISQGEFGSFMRDIFWPESAARFDWERWATLRGKRNYVFSYVIDQSHSTYQMSIMDTGQQIVPAYKGLIYVDRDTKMITRITLSPFDIPVAFPIRDASEVLDYDIQKIGESEFMLPLKAVLISHGARLATKNDIEFRLYNKFGTESTIKFDTPEPLPEEKTKETPVQR